MGLFANTKSVKKAATLYEAHRCSACGELNAAKHKLILRYRYDEIALSRSGSERASLAQQRLDEAADELMKRAADRDDVSKLYDLDLLGKCRKCGHKEPWSRIRMRFVEPIFNVMIVVSFVALLGAVIGLFTGANAALLIAAGALTAATIGVAVFRHLHRKKRENASAALDEENLPFLTDDEDVFREKYPGIDPEGLEIIEPAGNIDLGDF